MHKTNSNLLLKVQEIDNEIKQLELKLEQKKAYLRGYKEAAETMYADQEVQDDLFESHSSVTSVSSDNSVRSIQRYRCEGKTRQVYEFIESMDFMDGVNFSDIKQNLKDITTNTLDGILRNGKQRGVLLFENGLYNITAKGRELLEKTKKVG